jgi:hypothetical protein
MSDTTRRCSLVGTGLARADRGPGRSGVGQQRREQEEFRRFSGCGRTRSPATRLSNVNAPPDAMGGKALTNLRKMR